MKLTRKSYKRKIVVFGVMMVLAISLISTGFAAWIISQGAETNAGGNVEVGVVTDKSVEITDLNFYAACYEPDKADLANKSPITLEGLEQKPIKFSFDPVYEDVDGKVKFDQEAYNKAEKVEKGSGTGFEALKFRVTGTIKNAKMLKDVTLDFKVNDAVKAAATAGFIVLPTYSYTDPSAKATYTLQGAEIDKTQIETKDTATFDFTVEIKWGEKFHSMNPSLYFDTKEFEGPEANPAYDYSLAEVKAALEEIRGTIYGVAAKPDQLDFDGRKYNAYDAEALAGATAPTFKLTITAVAN